jgi:tRNA dimethylallyltransferase
MDIPDFRPLVAIVGATATGKTALAAKLASALPSVLISADSRQLYRGMDIVPGKDQPADHPLAGIDILNPEDAGSVAVWRHAVTPTLKKTWGEGRLPIVVGGTGLYVKALLEDLSTLAIQPDADLRKKLQKASVVELQIAVADLAPARYASLNESDRQNPRRLLRALEIARAVDKDPHSSDKEHLPTQAFLLGLRYQTEEHQRAAIHTRVLARLEDGALDETRGLAMRASPQALSALGYAQIGAYLAGACTYSEMVEAWVQAEMNYTKRQKTWFAKMTGITWYEVESLEVAQVVQHVKAWYDSLKEAKTYASTKN